MADSLRILWDDAYILLRGRSSFLIAARAGTKFPLRIETDAGEIIQGMYPEDIIAVSAVSGGEILPALYLLEQVRTHHFPIVALPEKHAAAGCLPYVISANDRIELTCDKGRGTHPEQNILCSADELTGMILYSENGCLIIENPRPGIAVERIRFTPEIIVEKTD
ncbi:MAG TPA: alpha/beta hydrolase [Methanocorpusculum sp.]|nr:alpha/beta hydrolase [Methanocorpusculum sp.]